MSIPDLVFIGSPSLDRLQRDDLVTEAIGGAAFISALAARASEATVGLVARVPTLLPTAVARTLGPGGLLREGLTTADGALPTFHIAYDAEDRATYTHVDNGLEATLSGADLPATWGEARWIHLAAIGEDAHRQLEVLATIRERGVAAKISAGTYRRMIVRDTDAARELLRRADLFFCNAEEYTLLCPHGPPEDTVVCVTQGPQGVTVYGGPHDGNYPVDPVEVVDATGAGDAFCGGFLAGLARGDDPVARGAQAAQLVLSGAGAGPLIETVAAQVGVRAAPVPAQITRVAAALASVAEAATLDFTYAPHLPAGHPLALPMLCIATMHQFGFWTSDPSRGWVAPMYAEIDGVRYKGSDFVWAAFARAAKTDPTLLDPARMAAEPNLLETLCRADDGRCPLPEVARFAALHQAHGEAMCSQWPGGYRAMLADCNAHAAPVARLLAHLTALPGYGEDPLAKKANLLAIVLGNRPERFLALRDPEHIQPIVDYHLMRGCLRTGCVAIVDPDLARRNEERLWVDAPEERAIRDAAKVAIDALVAQSGTSVPAVDGFFFTLGRRICLETEPPQCDRCPLESCCEKRIARFQPIIRTTYY